MYYGLKVVKSMVVKTKNKRETSNNFYKSAFIDSYNAIIDKRAREKQRVLQYLI